MPIIVKGISRPEEFPPSIKSYVDERFRTTNPIKANHRGIGDMSFGFHIPIKMGAFNADVKVTTKIENPRPGGPALLYTVAKTRSMQLKARKPRMKMPGSCCVSRSGLRENKSTGLLIGESAET